MLNLLLISSLAASQGAARPLDVPAVDRYINAVMAEWKVTGLSVGIIRDGQVVLAKGYGYRDVEQKLPVTPETVMAIGSNTKSFTTTLMAMLADSGKLDWEKPVRDYLPDFQLFDGYVTREMTPRDLVSHVSGLPRHDLLWYGRKFTRQELVPAAQVPGAFHVIPGAAPVQQPDVHDRRGADRAAHREELGRPGPGADLRPRGYDAREHLGQRPGEERRFLPGRTACGMAP